jgi:hypothetical protein
MRCEIGRLARQQTALQLSFNIVKEHSPHCCGECLEQTEYYFGAFLMISANLACVSAAVSAGSAMNDVKRSLI